MRNVTLTRISVIFILGFSLGWLSKSGLISDNSSPISTKKPSEIGQSTDSYIVDWGVSSESTADAFITNSQRGKAYLTNTLQAKPERIFARPYEVAEAKTLLAKTETDKSSTASVTHPVFLFVGQVIPRKGLDQLLKACAILQQQNYSNYTLQIIGDGEQRPELEQWTKTQGLEQLVQWLGWVNYVQ